MGTFTRRQAVFVLAAFGSETLSGGATLQVGDRAPDFTLSSTAGGTVHLSDYRGRSSVVLAFFPKAFTGG